MKKRLISIVAAMMLVLTSIMPTYAATQLTRPVIDDVKVSTTYISLDWNNVKHADGYDVYRATSKDGKYQYIDTSETSSYKDYDAKQGKKYYYKIKAVTYDDDYIDSKFSKWRSGKLKKASTASYSKSMTGISTTVYITNTGSKYHQGWCSYLRQSKHAISLSSARSQGYDACSRCF